MHSCKNFAIVGVLALVAVLTINLFFSAHAEEPKKDSSVVMCPCFCSDFSTLPSVAPTKKEQVGNEVTEKWWEVLIDGGIKLGIGVIVTMLSVLLSVLGKKYKLEQETALINDILQKAVSYAEQISWKSVKNGQTKLLSTEKMRLAITFAEQQAQARKLPKKWQGKWQDLLESWLGAKNESTSEGKSSTV